MFYRKKAVLYIVGFLALFAIDKCLEGSQENK